MFSLSPVGFRSARLHVAKHFKYTLLVFNLFLLPRRHRLLTSNHLKFAFEDSHTATATPALSFPHLCADAVPEGKDSTHVSAH